MLDMLMALISRHVTPWRAGQQALLALAAYADFLFRSSSITPPSFTISSLPPLLLSASRFSFAAPLYAFSLSDTDGACLLMPRHWLIPVQHVAHTLITMMRFNAAAALIHEAIIDAAMPC